MAQNIIIAVTMPSKKVANLICEQLLDKRLIVCCQNLGKIKSTYFWQNKKIKSAEILILLIAVKKNFDKIAKEIKKLHPYKTPQITAFDIAKTTKDYAAWIKRNGK